MLSYITPLLPRSFAKSKIVDRYDQIRVDPNQAADPVCAEGSSFIYNSISSQRYQSEPALTANFTNYANYANFLIGQLAKFVPLAQLAVSLIYPNSPNHAIPFIEKLAKFVQLAKLAVHHLWTRSFPRSGFQCRMIFIRHRLPIDHIPPGFNVFGTAVLIFQIIGMFPDIQSQDWRRSFTDGAILIWCAADQ